MLVAELMRRMDRQRFLPELCCLKRLDRLGEALAGEAPVFTNLLAGKYDVRVLWRLRRLMRRRRIDAVVTVGPGDKMFWGGWRPGWRACRWSARPCTRPDCQTTSRRPTVCWRR